MNIYINLLLILCFSLGINLNNAVFAAKSQQPDKQNKQNKQNKLGQSDKSGGSCFNHPAMHEIKSVVDQILADLQAKKDSIKDRKVVYGIINERLVPKADFKIMSRLVLTNRWNKLNAAQQEKFIKEFSRLMIRTYGVAFESYDGETVHFHCPIRELPGNKDRIEVSSTIKHTKQPDNSVKFRILKINKSCQTCDNKISSCKIVGENCKELKQQNDPKFEDCSKSYDECRSQVTSCKADCDKCQNCKDNCEGCNIGWQVYDLIIDNISIIDSYRQAFADKFRKSTSADSIIADMHEKNCKEKMYCD